MKKRPHIIIFNPDQMRSDALAHLGNPASHTPFLDEFARNEAVSFRNAYCQNTVCVPSRCSFFTGLYPHVHGHRTMSYLLREGEESLFTELMGAGYEVWMNSRNDLVAGQIDGLMEKHATEIYYGGECAAAPGPENPDIRGSKGDKNYYSHYLGKLGHDKHNKNYTKDDEDVDAAIKKIKSRDSQKPLCMFLGLIYPHPNYAVEEPYFSAINRKKLPERVKASQTKGKAKMLNTIQNNQQLEQYTEKDWAELRAVYLGMCMKVDEQFKKLCCALKECGMYDDSAIFFLSDHGDYTGDYDISEKSQNTFEDCLTKVPLLIKPPKNTGVAPGITDSIVELVDFYGTVLDYVGVKGSHSYFGRSLRPVINDRQASIRKYAFCEGGRMDYEYHCDEFHSGSDGGTPERSPYYPRLKAQTDHVAHGKATMITDGKCKYIKRIYEKDEFYDLECDPKEKINEIENVKYKNKITEMKLEMLNWFQSTCDIVPYDHDKRYNFDTAWARIRQVCPREHREEARKRLQEGENMYTLIAYYKQLGR